MGGEIFIRSLLQEGLAVKGIAGSLAHTAAVGRTVAVTQRAGIGIRTHHLVQVFVDLGIDIGLGSAVVGGVDLTHGGEGTVEHRHRTPFGHQGVEAEGADEAGLGLIGLPGVGIRPGDVVQMGDEFVGVTDAGINALITVKQEFILLREGEGVPLIVGAATRT